MLRRLIHAQERRRAARDTNRLVRPFTWGAEFIAHDINGDDPRHIFQQHTARVLAHSEEFYALPPVNDYHLTSDNQLTWTSSVHTPSPENNTARARFFPVKTEQPQPPGRWKNRKALAKREDVRRAVVILPQWNADEKSHVELCHILNRFQIAALRMTLPYHEARRPPELARADHLISSNIGRTIQSMRQAALDTRAGVRWLTEQAGYNRIGIIGTSIGSCTAFLAFAHDPKIEVGVFNHVSGYFADVVWRGISTQHVRAGFGDEITLEELRAHWLPISPFAFAERLLKNPSRPMRFIAARYDLTFPRDLSRDVIERVKQLNLRLDVSWLPCGHYTSGEKPWVYLDGWKIVSFFRKHL